MRWKATSRSRVSAVFLCTVGALGCAADATRESPSPAELTSFDEFARELPRVEALDAWVVEGDLLVRDSAELHAVYDAYIEARRGQRAPLEKEVGAREQPLIINRFGGADDRWSSSQALNLTYCISPWFGALKGQVVSAMNAATQAWEAVANVNFVYVPEQDGTCTPSNNNVVFDVEPIDSQDDFLGSAFVPHEPRGDRQLWIDIDAFNAPGGVTLTGVLRHELGHVLGFRHETARDALWALCYEDPNWRPVTARDFNSVMNTRGLFCGAGTGDLVLTASDANGAACIYGPAPGQPRPSCIFPTLRYATHVSGYGWLPPVWGGDTSGALFEGAQIEAVRFTSSLPGTPSVCYRAHVAGLGWLSEVCNNATGGTTGESRRVEAIRVRVASPPPGCGISYQTFFNGSWQAAVSNDQVSGSTGQGTPLEAVRAWFTGNCLRPN
jgi:serralysin